MGIPAKQKVYPVDLEMIFPVAGHGRPRQHHLPNQLSRPVEAVLADADWQTLSWRRGTKGRLATRFAALRVRLADGPPQRIHDMGAKHLPGEEVWAVGEHAPQASASTTCSTCLRTRISTPFRLP